MSQQQQQQASTGKDLPPAHQASMPQAPRTNPYPQTGYTSVVPQVYELCYSYIYEILKINIANISEESF